MENGLKAIEQVQLGTSMDPLPRASLEGGGVVGGGSDVMDRLIRGPKRKVKTGAHYVWYVMAYWLFRVLSTLNLIGGVLIGVYSQVFAYYYRGALCAPPLIAAIFYAPALGGMAILRENILSDGTSRSGVGPARSRAVLFAYAAILGSIGCSVLQPILGRWTHGLSRFSMALALVGTGVFFYSLLISEVLFAAAVNLEHSRGLGAGEDKTDESGRYESI